MKNYEIEINGETYRVAVKELAVDADMAVNDQPVASAPAAVPTPAATGTGIEVKAPMPGTILSVNVSPGQTVAQGDVLAILEAMKMENEIVAPTGGVISEIVVSANDSVQSDQVLFVL